MESNKITSAADTVESSDNKDMHGPLTEDKWIRFNEKLWSERENSGKVFDQIKASLLIRSTTDYRTIATSDRIIADFLSWPESVQVTVSDFISYDVTVSTIEAYVDLLFKLQEHSLQNNMNLNFLEVSAKDISMFLALSNQGQMSRRFPAALNGFCEFIGRDPLIYRNAYYMLAFVYGDERVIEVSTKWAENTASKNLGDFIHLVDQWDTLKRYPVEWAINLLKTE